MTDIAIVGDIHIRDTNPRSRIDDYKETCIDKIDKILNKHKYLLCLGDFFDSANVSIEYLNYLILRLSPYKGRIHTIVGNHDSSYRSVNLNKTALGLLSNVGVISTHTEYFELSGESFDVCSVVPKLLLPPKKSSNLLGHFYLEDTRSPSESLNIQDLLEYTNVFIGHDHTPHGAICLDSGTNIFRMGSLTRLTSDSYNLDRYSINYCVLKDGLTSLDSIDVLPPEQVFNPDSFNKQVTKSTVDFSSLDKLISNFKGRTSGESMSTRKVLSELDCPEPCVEYLAHIHEKFGLFF